MVLAWSGTTNLWADEHPPAEPLLTVTPSVGSPGESVTIRGINFPNTPFSLLYDTDQIGSIVNPVDGNWNQGIVLPDSTTGSHVIDANGTRAFFEVIPSVRIFPNRGAIGTRVTITGKGFASRQTGITVEINDDVVASEVANEVGSFTATFNLPRLPADVYEINIANVETVDFEVTSTFSISPQSGPPGTSVVVIGSGFEANSSVSVRLDGQTIQQVNTTDDGQLSSSVQIPQISGGTKILSIAGGSSKTAQATFDVTPTFSADRTNAPPGTSVNVTGSGFGPNESGITIKFDSEPVATGIVADAKGRWTGDFKVPTATSGSHVIRASGFLTRSGVAPLSLSVGAGIDLDQGSGPPGTVVRVSGSGVGPRERVKVTVGDELVTVEAVANSQGVWSVDLTIPSAPRSSLAIRAGGLDALGATTSFNVTSAVSISEQTAIPGGSITIKGEGYGANQSGISINFNDTIVASVAANGQGSWTGSFTVPAAPKGTYQIYIDGGNSELEVPLSITPRLVLTQRRARPGETNSISGSGFGADERDIKVTLNNTTLASGINANTDGSWNTNFLVPLLPSGSYRLSASGAQTSAANVQGESLTLALDLLLNRGSGPPGTIVTLDGKGFSAREGDIKVLYDGTTVLTGIVADNLGAFSASLGIPLSGAGRHSLEIVRSTGAPGPAASVSFQVVPKIQIDNFQGPPGSTVIVSGSGFVAGEKNIALFYSGRLLSTTINAGPDGSFSAPFVLPDTPTGDHAIQVVGPASASASLTHPEQSFHVIPTVELSHNSGAVGLALEIIGKGFGPGVLVKLTYGEETEQTVVTEASGSFRAVVTVPISAAGEHLLRISDETGNRKQAVFVVENTPPPAPVLLFPRSGSKGGLFGGYQPVSRWSEVEDPSGVSYSVMVARDPDFFDIILERSELLRPSYALNEFESLPRGKYYWRVAATDQASNVSPWSETFVMNSGIIPVWVIPAVVALGILMVSGTGYTFVYRPWRQRQTPGMPDFIRISRPDVATAGSLPTPPPATRALAAPPRRALPSPFRRGRGLSPEDQARLQSVVDFLQSLPLIEVSADLSWLEELVEELGGIREDMYELVLMGQVDLAYQPAWIEHPTYEELQQTPQARIFLQGLDEYVNAVSECAVDTTALLRQIYGSLLTANPPEALDDGQWRLVLAVAVGTISWFRGTFLAQPSPRDYVVRPASDSVEEVFYSLDGADRTPFAYPLVEGFSESDAVFYRDLHIQLRNIFRTNEDTRLLAAKMAATDALRNQLLQSIAQMGQNAPGQ